MISRFIDTAKIHSALAAILSLTSCLHHGDATDDGGSSADEPLGEMVSCATNNTSVFNDNCRLERDAGGLLVIHNPDGSFRRLRLSPTGQITTADGFLQAITNPAQSGGTEVRVGDDRYVIPPPQSTDGGSGGDAPLAADTSGASSGGASSGQNAGAQSAAIGAYSG